MIYFIPAVIIFVSILFLIIKKKDLKKSHMIFFIVAIIALSGGIVLYEVLSGNVSSSESDSSTYFPWVVFLPIWISLIQQKKDGQNPLTLDKKKKILLLSLLGILVLFIVFVLIFNK